MAPANQPIAKEQYSNVQPIWKFCFLYIITYGFYQIAWSHKQWKFIKERENLKINAWFRSLFIPFYLYNLCQKIFALAEEEGYRNRPSPFIMTLIYWICFVLDLSPVSFNFVWLFSLIPLITLLRAFNFYWAQKQPNLPVIKSFTGREIVWIVVGVIIWLLIIRLPAQKN